jgi:hypothetical protein
MSTDELAGRICAVEVIAMTSLGIYLANSTNDADYKKAAALLEHLQKTIDGNAQSLPPGGEEVAKRYGAHLLETVSQSLRALRGEEGPAN